jgi:hypothetical protein
MVVIHVLRDVVNIRPEEKSHEFVNKCRPDFAMSRPYFAAIRKSGRSCLYAAQF